MTIFFTLRLFFLAILYGDKRIKIVSFFCIAKIEKSLELIIIKKKDVTLQKEKINIQLKSNLCK